MSREFFQDPTGPEYVFSMYHEALRTRASFANPAVTFARAMTDTFAGISPRSVPLFVVGQLIGGVAVMLFVHWLLGPKNTTPAD